MTLVDLRLAAVAAPMPEEPLAIRIADTLLRKDGASALRRARRVLVRATEGGDVVQADLFTAVCSVLLWRDRVCRR